MSMIDKIILETLSIPLSTFPEPILRDVATVGTKLYIGK